MGDSDEENYATFGVPLDPLDEGTQTINYRASVLCYKCSFSSRYIENISIPQRTSHERSPLRLRISMPMTPKVDVGFTGHLQVVSQRDTSTLSALAMAGDRSSSSLLGAVRRTISFNDQKISWMKKTRVSLGLLPKAFVPPAIMLIMDREGRRGRE